MAKNHSELTLSPTKVDTFSKCQRKFYYNYVNSPFPAIEHDFFVVGNIAHKALELFHGPDFYAKRWNENMASAFKQAVISQNAFEKINRGILTRAHLFEVKQMLRNYISFLQLGNAVNTFQLEKLVKVTINKVPVWMKADRVDRLPGGGYLVIDYKSSKNPASKSEEQNSVQIPSYGFWIREKIDKSSPLEGSYYYLRHMKSKRGVHTHTITADWMEKAANQYVHVYALIQNGCKYTKTTDKQVCRWCDYRLPCSSDFGFN